MGFRRWGLPPRWEKPQRSLSVVGEGFRAAAGVQMRRRGGTNALAVSELLNTVAKNTQAGGSSPHHA